jgi:hypothetical protein
MAVMRVRADIDGRKTPKPAFERLAGKASAQWARKHVGKDGEDAGAPGHVTISCA